MRRSQRSEPKYVLARRSDGLGERLNALLNAIRLADLLDVEFRLTWPLDHADDLRHAIVPADQFFAPGFVSAHLVDHDATAEGFVLPAGPADDLDAVRAQLAAARRGLLAPNRSLVSRIDPEAVPAVLRGYSSEFARIDFDPGINAAISSARAVPLEADSVGIHLRAGDLLHGKFRGWNRFWTKVISAPVARALIKHYREEGRTVLVFGQDAYLIAELCASTGAVDAVTMRPADGLPRAGEAMFDLVLLSRCARIIGGSSGFAVQAALISDKQVDFHYDLLTPTDIVTITRDDATLDGDRYDPQQRAFAWWVAFHGARRDLANDEAVALLEAALQADPSNPRYHLRLAALEYRNGQYTKGDDPLTEAVIGDVAKGDEALESVLLFSLMHGDGSYDSREIFGDIEGAAASGSRVAAIYRAALRASRGDLTGAEEDVTTFAAHAADDDRLSGLASLPSLIEATIAERASSADRPG